MTIKKLHVTDFNILKYNKHLIIRHFLKYAALITRKTRRKTKELRILVKNKKNESPISLIRTFVIIFVHKANRTGFY